MQVREKLGPLDPYFVKLADAMAVWIEAWQQLNPPGTGQANGVATANGVHNAAAPAMKPAKPLQNGVLHLHSVAGNGAKA